MRGNEASDPAAGGARQLEPASGRVKTRSLFYVLRRRRYRKEACYEAPASNESPRKTPEWITTRLRDSYGQAEQNGDLDVVMRKSSVISPLMRSPRTVGGHREVIKMPPKGSRNAIARKEKPRRGSGAS